MSRSIIVSDADFARLCKLAGVLGKRNGKAVDFPDVIYYLLESHSS